MGERNLFEMDSTGDYYTWSNKHVEGTIYSRIDRVLDNVEWFQNNINTSLQVLPPSVSDHGLLFLQNQEPQYPKKPRFKYLNCVTDVEGYEQKVINNWNEPIVGRPMYVLWQKLRRLHPILKKLNKPLVLADQNIKKAGDNMDKTQKDLVNDRLNISKINEVKRLTEELVKWQEIDEKVMNQRAKIEWLKKWDGNNSFFYATIKGKYHSKNIKSLHKDNGDIITSIHGIEDEILHFYGGLMGKKADILTYIDVGAMRNGSQLSRVQREGLIRLVTETEKHNALKGINDLKAPGLDGYGAHFFKHSWSIIKTDLIVPLILTARLGQVIGSIVQYNQAAFIPGQQIHNHILLAFEPLKGYTRKGGTPCCMIMIDLQKACDMVDWTALECITQEVGLPHQFIKWIMLTVSTVSYRFNINGELSKTLKAKRGIRGDLRSVKLLLQAFNSFIMSTSMKINPSKCRIYFGSVDAGTKEAILQHTKFSEGTLPFKYFGTPLTCKKLSISHYLVLVEKIQADSLWVKWVHTYYFKGRNLMEAKINNGSTWIFKKIMQQRESISTIQNSWDQMCNNGKFQMKIVYKKMRVMEPKVPWYRLIYKNAGRPHAVLTLWMVCHRKLATKDRLRKFDMLADSTCAFCSKEENIDHLLFDCDTMKEIWNHVLHWIHRHHQPKPWKEELEWLIQQIKGKGWNVELLKLAAAEAVYGAWRFRNDTCFGNHCDRIKIRNYIIDNIVYRGWCNRKLRPHS
ncbi:uncharacterized protein LOC131649480 [Vicia villosa]|uniref:uncharacterized protein LOC131649480 n=1 Tax=Vicia villosa TaxID=3911 RepID=UPI00273BD410|nr:uncharacterized protein LOC131649480 [Vicia villosa]